jgi:hypothetical protein
MTFGLIGTPVDENVLRSLIAIAVAARILIALMSVLNIAQWALPNLKSFER